MLPEMTRDGTSSAVDGTFEAFRSDLLQWAQANRRSFPWRGDDVGPYEILVAEIFLKKTRAETVAKVLPDFLDSFPDFRALSSATQDEIIDIIRPLGIYNHRADALLDIATQFQDSRLPRSLDELTKLPQVGRYVGSAVLSFAYGESYPIVDSNIRRVYSRLLHGQDLMSESLAWEIAKDALPDDAKTYNQALLDFASQVCQDADPLCSECFATSYCTYYNQKR